MSHFEFLIPLLLSLGLLWVFRARIIALLRGVEDMARGTRVAPEYVPKAVREAVPPSPDMLPLEEAMAYVRTMDPQRRRMLKLFGLGAGAFVVGKVLGPSFNILPGEMGDGTTFFRNFRLVERGSELAFYDRFGNEILVLEADDKEEPMV
jgi:hypothetical protein